MKETHVAANRWRLEGQLALVTGASAGIGLAIARELLDFGADVLMVARDEDALQDARADLADEFPERTLVTLAADVADDEDRRAILDWVEDHGDGLNILVNNAGGNVTRAAVDYTEDEWRGIFETNLFSAFELSRYAHPLLTRHAASSIVNVGSVSGITAVRSGAPYGMTKAALHQLTRNLAAEWAEDGVRVNAVAPWYIRTRRTSGPLSDADYYDEVVARTPMRRIGEPEEVAAAVAFLCLPAASYVTGECIAVDGGFLRYGFWATASGALNTTRPSASSTSMRASPSRSTRRRMRSLPLASTSRISASLRSFCTTMRRVACFAASSTFTCDGTAWLICRPLLIGSPSAPMRVIRPMASMLGLSKASAETFPPSTSVSASPPTSLPLRS
jgi:Dehydrogenases with different specificities (related to short-chain alcohol dehydrogenases)